MRDRGAALLMSMISIMILLLISSIFFTMVTNTLRTESLEEKIIKSYTLADAGINYTFSYVLNNIPSSGTPSTMTVVPPITQDLYISEDPNAHFTIGPLNPPPITPLYPLGQPTNEVSLAWGIDPVTHTTQLVSITVECTGYYLGVYRTLREQYAVTH